MIAGEALDEVKAAIGAAKEDLKVRCINDEFGKPIEFYRGGYAALEALEAALEFKAADEEHKAATDKQKDDVLANVDTLRTWMPGMPLLPRE